MRSLPWMLAAACGAPPVEVVAEPRPDVLLVTLDTTRADRLGAYGHAKARTDALDALAARGVRFARAYSPLPLTIPSHGTMFTGKNPPTHGIRSNGGGVLVESHRTLAEVLHDAGYATAASVSAFVTTRQWGFAQGFDAYFDALPEGGGEGANFWHQERRADAVVDDALAWLATAPADRPRFVWVHLYDAHFPYAPPEGYVDPADPRPYDGELAWVDDQVARLLDAFDERPAYVIVVGDHGEGLGEHGDLTHGMFAYDATQRVPWLMAGPGVEPAVIDEPVGLSDLMPTLLDRLDLPSPEGVEGQVRPAGEAARPVYMESWQLAQRFALAPHVGIVDGPYKLLDLPRPELYDLIADPHELVNLAEAEPERAAPVVAALRKRLDALDYAPPGDAAAGVDPGVAAELAALGYVDGAQPLDPDVVLPDPKDRADLLALAQRAERLEAEKDHAGAERVLRELVTRYPEVVEFKTRLGGLLARAGRREEAARLAAEGLEIAPDHPGLTSFLAGQLAAQGRFGEASAAFERVALAQPYAPRFRALAVASARHGGDRERAFRLAEGWITAYPDDLQLLGAYGVLLAEAGRVDQAQPLLERGLGASPPEAEVAWMLAVTDIRRGNFATALDRLAIEVKHHPGHFRAALVMARLGSKLGRWAEQLAGAEAVLAVRPTEVDAHHLRVLALFNLGRYAEARVAVADGLAVEPTNPDLILMDANLLAKEGRKDEGAARFEVAKAALVARNAARAGREASVAEELGVGAADGTTPVAPEDLPMWDLGRRR